MDKTKADVSIEQGGVLPPLSHLSADGWRVDSEEKEEGEEEEEELWIHWKDPYWKEFDSKTPLPEATTSTISSTAPWPGGGGRGATWANGTREELLDANGEAATYLVPLLLLLALALLLTVVGNALVCLVYRTRFRRTTANVYVVYLAGLELALAGLGVPMEMSTLALPLLFQSRMACKVVRYIQTASVFSLLLALGAVAVDRYRTRTRSSCARRLCAGSLVLGLCLALPSFLLFGAKTLAARGRPGVWGVACGVEDGLQGGVVAVIYTTLLAATSLITLITLAVLYVLVFLRQGKAGAGAQSARDGASPTKARDFPRKHRFVAEDSSSSFGTEETRKLSSGGGGAAAASGGGSGNSGGGSGGGGGGSGGASTPRSSRGSPGMDPARVPLRGTESARLGGGTGVHTSLDVRGAQMTWIFFFVSLVTLLSVVPFVVCRALDVMTSLRNQTWPAGAEVVWEVCLRLYLFHPPLVPLIYLLRNRHFRREAKVLVQRVGVPCRPSSADTVARPAR